MNNSDLKLIVAIALIIVTFVMAGISLMPVEKQETKSWDLLMDYGKPIHMSVSLDHGTAFEKQADITIVFSRINDTMKICTQQGCEEFPVKSEHADMDIENGTTVVAESWYFYAEHKILADWTFHKNGTVTQHDMSIGTWWQ